MKTKLSMTPPDITYNVSDVEYIPVGQFRGLSGFLPTEFVWRSGGWDNDVILRFKKKNLARVKQQGACGSCWAISTIDSLNDALIVSNVSSNPDISPTSAMSCYTIGDCEGGNPLNLLKAIENKGIPGSGCMNYDWCKSKKECNSPFVENTKFLNEKIPSCGCYLEGYYKTYKVKDAKILVDEDGDTIKRHIMNVGPVVGTMLIPSYFEEGFFEKTKGVYLDRANYDIGKPLTFREKVLVSPSAHSMSVVGWGTETNVVINNAGDVSDVPYWVCKNSWGTEWADGGYVKLARYPFNKWAQIDKPINKDVNTIVGGTIIFNVNTNPQNKWFNKVNVDYNPWIVNHKYLTSSNIIYMVLTILLISFILIILSKRKVKVD